jgi:dihydrolipoamide dehydrogenase
MDTPTRGQSIGDVARELGISVHAHPTLAEIVGEAALAVTGQAINF